MCLKTTWLIEELKLHLWTSSSTLEDGCNECTSLLVVLLLLPVLRSLSLLPARVCVCVLWRSLWCAELCSHGDKECVQDEMRSSGVKFKLEQRRAAGPLYFWCHTVWGIFFWSFDPAASCLHSVLWSTCPTCAAQVLIYRCPSVAGQDTHLRIGVDHEFDILFICFKSDDLHKTLEHSGLFQKSSLPEDIGVSRKRSTQSQNSVSLVNLFRHILPYVLWHYIHNNLAENLH